MILFHGSKNGIIGDIKPNSRCDCDFGTGFYMSESKHLCEAWVSDYKFDNPKVYELDFSYNDLKTYRFNVDRDWYLFIAYNRINDKIKKYSKVVEYIKRFDNYDLLIGTIADDRLIYSLNEFFDNRINEKALMSCLDVFNYGLQYVAKTEKACKEIKIINVEELIDDVRNNNNAEVDHRLESIKDVVEQVRVRYRNADSKYFDEILEEF